MKETKTVGPPPAPEVALRTLNSDARSIAAGEVKPQPEIVHPPKAEVQSGGRLTIEKPGKKSKLLLWIIILAVLIAAGAAAFFFFSSSQESSLPELEIQN